MQTNKKIEEITQGENSPKTAGFVRRFLAKLVDIVFVSAVSWPILPFVLVFGIKFTASEKVIFLLTPIFYQAVICFMEARYKGQSPGKRLLGIKVVSYVNGEGSEMTRKQSWIRYGGWVVGIASFGIGPAMALFDEKSRSLHDKMSGTASIRV